MNRLFRVPINFGCIIDFECLNDENCDNRNNEKDFIANFKDIIAERNNIYFINFASAV